MAGFRLVGRLSGGAPNIRNVISADTTLHIGDMVNMEGSAGARAVDLAASNDSRLVGVVLGPVDAADGNGGTLTLNGTTDQVRVCIDEDAIYAVADANVRHFGDLLDLDAGATGAQGVTTANDNDFAVIADSTASEPTLVILSQTNHVTAGN